MNYQDKISIRIALSEGKQMYKTSRKFRNQPVYESLNPETRKLMGLKPLSELGFYKVGG